MSASSPSLSADLAKQREALRAELDTALEEEEDPLAAYENFIKWTLQHYGPDSPDSGLKELLEEVTSRFKNDPSYKGDLRYLKLWALYSRQVKKPTAIFKFLGDHGIGVAYALLYEEYAQALETESRIPEANAVFLAGIKRQARPIERLKKRHREFQSRHSDRLSQATPASGTTAGPSKPSSPASSQAAQDSLLGPSHKRYLPMLAPPAPGRRPEKLRFDLSLLFTSEGIEYSAAEARARAMGLLGKKWAAPSPSESQPETSTAAPVPSSSTLNRVPVDFNDKGTSSRALPRKSAVGGGAEPTVTINTKEALADVFGMYNSPEKTTRIKPGSKYAPVRKVQPVTPAVKQSPLVPQATKEENLVVKTPAFRPFLDETSTRKENATPGITKFTPFIDGSKENCITPGPAKFTPFIDAPELPNKTPDIARRALSVKDTTPGPLSSLPRPKVGDKNKPASLKPIAEDTAGNVFSKVFTLAAKGSSAALEPDTISENPAFVPFVDTAVKTPFKVFSRPPQNPQSENYNAITPRPGAFTPYRDAPLAAVTPTPSMNFASNRSLQPLTEALHEDIEQEEAPRHEEANETFEDEGEEVLDQQEEEPSPVESEEADVQDFEAGSQGFDDYDDPEESYRAPLGGRFGTFDVMTPITERTFEFTMTTRGPMTPSDAGDPANNTGKGMLEYEAVEAAERLAAELRDEENPDPQTAVPQEDYEDYESFDKEPDMPPFRLSDGHTIDRTAAAQIDLLEEKTGTLNLTDALTLRSRFKPPNPCNPFDPPILTTLLSLFSAEPGFNDWRDQEANLLSDLQKFAQKQQRKSAGRAEAAQLPITVGDQKFTVLEKLGEGGFGAVFLAKDLSAKSASDDEFDEDDVDDDDDDGENGSSKVALKVVKPRNIWEFHILRRMRAKLSPRLRSSVVAPRALYALRDESFLVMEYSPQGSLLDVVNSAGRAGISQQGSCLDELLVMFFSIEMMRLLEGMHRAGFIHGDLKIDNCLLRLEEIPGGAAAWSSIYEPSGDEGWSYKGVRVIDFGRTIDVQLFPADQEFIADWPTDARDCLEMRENRPWTYQTDYFGLAGIIYCMLFGKYIEGSSVIVEEPTAPGGPPRYKLATPFKRYWQGDLWRRLFDLLLNPCVVRPDGQLPLCEELAGIRKEMESWLQTNCDRTSNTLKGLLKKIERSVLDSK